MVNSFDYNTQFENVWKEILYTKREVQSSRLGKALSVPHCSVVFDMSKGQFPIWSKGSFNKCAMQHELSVLFGGSRIREQGGMTVYPSAIVDFWTSSAGPDALKTLKLDHCLKPYELGATYGYQMRFYNGTYPSTQFKLESDQLLSAIVTLRKDPFDRRIVLNLFNPIAHPVVIQPCMHSFTFTYNLKEKLCLFVNQRSADVSVAMSYNIYTAAYFLVFMSAMTGLEPGLLTWHGANCHIYLNNKENSIAMMKNTERPLPFYWFDSMKDMPLTPDESGAIQLDAYLNDFNIHIANRIKPEFIPDRIINGV
jgi:thymidylate synthase